MASIFVVDNYDSFTYNLVHQLEELGASVCVQRNDCFQLEELEPFSKILLSPGPGIPNEAGLLKKVIERYGPSHSILGICLGHQAIAEVYGGLLENLPQVFHGLATPHSHHYRRYSFQRPASNSRSRTLSFLGSRTSPPRSLGSLGPR